MDDLVKYAVDLSSFLSKCSYLCSLTNKLCNYESTRNAIVGHVDDAC